MNTAALSPAASPRAGLSPTPIGSGMNATIGTTTPTISDGQGMSSGQPQRVLASALLASALQDAKSLLQGAQRDDLQNVRHDLMLADLPENQPGVAFHGGGT